MVDRASLKSLEMVMFPFVALFGDIILILILRHIFLDEVVLYFCATIRQIGSIDIANHHRPSAAVGSEIRALVVDRS